MSSSLTSHQHFMFNFPNYSLFGIQYVQQMKLLFLNKPQCCHCRC